MSDSNLVEGGKSTMDTLTSSSSRRFSDAFLYVLENKDKESWTIEPTPNVRLAKRYFRELAFGRVTKEQVAKVLKVLLVKESSRETWGTIHLSLFLHTNHPDVEEMFEIDDLNPINPPYSARTGICEEDYNWLISGLGLDPHFMYQPEEAIVALQEVKNDDATVEKLLKRLVDSDFSVLTFDEFKGRRNEIVKLAFRDGVHDRYETQGQGLTNVLGSLRMRMKSISTMTGTERHMFVDEIFLWAFRNPVLTMMVLVTNSVRIKNCVLLRELQVFLELPIGEANSNPQMSPATRLFEFALYKVIFELDETSPEWHFFYTGLSILVEQNFIEVPRLVEILIILIREFATSSTVDNTGNLMKLFKCVLTPFLEKGMIPAEEMKEIKRFVSNILKVTYLADENRAVMAPRATCLLLLKVIDEKLAELNGQPEIDESPFPDNDGSTLHLGLIYIRLPGKRVEVEKFIQEQAEDPKWTTMEALRELTEDVICLISVCCRLELEGVAKFIRVLVQNKAILKGLGFHRFMNRILSVGFEARNLRTSKFLGFYSSYMEFIQVGEGGEEFATAYEDHLEIIKTLVSLMFGIYKSADGTRLAHAVLNKKALVSGRIFDILYELVDWVHGRQVIYPEKVKAAILKIVSMIPKFVQPSPAHTAFGIRYQKALDYLSAM